jgi:magnesium-protoporphyrin IX monomethyl ester (oxidative) cyclase
LRYEAVDNILPKSYIEEVLPKLNAPQNATIFYEVKADLSEEDVQTLAKARVMTIQPGIEALNTSTLKLMKKGTSAFQNLKLLKNCALYGVFPAWNLLIGFPREEADVYQKYVKDLPSMVHLPPPTGAFPVRFDRFSPYFTQAKEYELDLHPFDFYQFIYPFNGDSLASLAYYFVDRNFGARYMTDMLEWVGKVREKINIWLTRYYGGDQGPAPKLYLKAIDGSYVIHDSRTGEVIEHSVDEERRAVLEFLEKPRRVKELASAVPDNPAFDPEKEMAFLSERGLVFQEGDRFMSLVLSRDAPLLAHPTY